MWLFRVHFYFKAAKIIISGPCQLPHFTLSYQYSYMNALLDLFLGLIKNRIKCVYFPFSMLREFRLHKLTGGQGVRIHCKRVRNAILVRTRHQHTCQRAKWRHGCYLAHFNSQDNNASYKRLNVQQKVTEFYRFTDYEDTIRLLYLNGLRNYEHISLLVCVLAEENPRPPHAISS